MLQKQARGCALCFLSLIPLVLVSANQTNAQGRIQARVVGFPVRVEGGTRLDSAVTARLGETITVQIEPPLSEQQTTTSSTTGSANQPASTDNKSGDQAGDQKKNPTPSDEQSWIPGLSHAQVLKLVPYFNARPLKGVYPEAVDPNNHTLTFHLERTEASEEAWIEFLSNPRFEPRVLAFSIGLEDKAPFDSTAILKLIVISKSRFIPASVFFVIVLYIFFRLAAATSLLRDPGISLGHMPGFSIMWRRSSPDTRLGPFSLARTQMAYWFFMVIIAFVLIWMITGATNTITQGVLVLIGISAGTALGATAIDSSKRPKTSDPSPGQESRGFLNDILSDDTGVSFHRFQIVVWTIVLGMVFSKSVMSHLAMPDFSTTLLTLMGISSGTYLGLKLPEQQAPESPPTKPPRLAQAGPQSQQSETDKDGDDKAQ